MRPRGPRARPQPLCRQRRTGRGRAGQHRVHGVSLAIYERISGISKEVTGTSSQYAPQPLFCSSAIKLCRVLSAVYGAQDNVGVEGGSTTSLYGGERHHLVQRAGEWEKAGKVHEVAIAMTRNGDVYVLHNATRVGLGSEYPIEAIAPHHNAKVFPRVELGWVIEPGRQNLHGIGSPVHKDGLADGDIFHLYGAVGIGGPCTRHDKRKVGLAALCIGPTAIKG